MSRLEAIQRTSSMLLQGWKMLNISCPLCNSILLSQKQDTIMWCSGCNLPVKSESSMGNSIESNESPIESMKDKDIEVSVAINELDLYEEKRLQYELKNKDRDRISQLLGEKMLGGWTLLGAICPKQSCFSTPLMRELNDTTGVMICVSCNEQYIQDEYNRIVMRDFKGIPSTSNKKLDINDAPILKLYDSNQSDEWSKELSKKMLQGCALLESSCSHCRIVPLLRDKNGKVNDSYIQLSYLISYYYSFELGVLY